MEGKREMKDLDFVINHFKSRCLDDRDVYRLAEYVPDSKLYLLGFESQNSEHHVPRKWNRENILADLKRDIEFGYEKAVNERYVSASLMFLVVKMWDWILTDNEQPLETLEDIIICLNSDNLNSFEDYAKKYNIILEGE